MLSTFIQTEAGPIDWRVGQNVGYV